MTAAATKAGRRPKKNAPKRRQVTKAEAADLLGLSIRRIEQLVSERQDVPCLGTGRHRRFLWPQLREWRDKQLLEQGRVSTFTESIEESRARKLAAEADLTEMERDVERGELVSVAIYRQEVEGSFSRLRAALLNAPLRYAPQLCESLGTSQADPEARARIVEDFLSMMVREIMADLEAGEDIPDVEDESGPS